jgi:hypothetical protein
VPLLVFQGRLSADSGAAKTYHPKASERSRLRKFGSEIRRLKALLQAKYGPEALAIAKRRRLPVGIIYCLAERKPALSPGTHATRRMRARESGRMMPIGNTWEHRHQGGKCYFLNGKVFTARLHIDGRTWQWPLKVIDEEKANERMVSVRLARQNLRRAAADELDCEIGTDAATAAATALVAARAQLADAIIKAGGPKELADFVLKGPQEVVGTDIRQRTAIPRQEKVGTDVMPRVTIPRAERRALRLAAQENCVQADMKLMEASPDGAPEGRATLEKKMMKDFGVLRDDARKARAEAIRRMRQSLPPDSKWDQPGALSKWDHPSTLGR